ncbi:hypothetical protein WG906_09845 [Pedobacter sp. P351]|uniref:hypothetical protein n=1 Tax=Pedobacter superstes TaxID=3133441 RepID=UPI003094D8BA
MSIRFVILLFIIFLISACSVKEDLCAAYLCDAPRVHLKIKFKDSNNQDLLFSLNAPYSPGDLKVRSTLFNEDLQFWVDSADKSNKYIILPLSYSQHLTLKLGDKTEDVIKIEASVKEAGCCETIKILSLKLNQTTICTNCNSIEPIILIK